MSKSRTYISELHFLQILAFISFLITYPNLAAFPHLGQINFVFETLIGIAIFTTWPFSPCFFGFTCFCFKFTPSTKTLFSFGKDFNIFAVFPLSLPAMINTVSSFLSFTPFRSLGKKYFIHKIFFACTFLILFINFILTHSSFYYCIQTSNGVHISIKVILLPFGQYYQNLYLLLLLLQDQIPFHPLVIFHLLKSLSHYHQNEYKNRHFF